MLTTRRFFLIVFTVSAMSAWNCDAQSSHRDFWDQPTVVVRWPKIFAVEAFRQAKQMAPDLLKMRATGRGLGQQEPNSSQLSQEGSLVIKNLESLSDDRGLTEEDLREVWVVIRKLHSSGFQNRDRVLSLYSDLHKLPLPPKSQLETIRFLGQDLYFRTKYKEANEMFTSAIDVDLNGISDENHQFCAERLGNIFYLRGLALTKDGRPDETIDNFERITSDPLILRHLPEVTKLSVYNRLGQVCYEQKEFQNSEKAYSKGIELLDKSTKREREFRIQFEVGLAKARTMAEDSETPDLDGLFETMNSLRKKFSGKGYPDFDDLLRSRIVLAREIDDDKLYTDSIHDLRDYYKKKHEFTHAWDGNEEDYFLDASALLIAHHLENKDEEEAQNVLLETKELTDPPEYWFNRFPREFRKKALENSVLDKDKQ